MNRQNLNDIMLWIDENLNHRFFENFVAWNYWLWNHTSYAFCQWVCDNFETFEGE